MVNFNNETTVGTPAVEVVRILILQRRSDVIEAFELYKKQYYSGITPNIALVRGRIYSLFLELQGSLKRKYNKKKKDKEKDLDYNDIKSIVESKKFDDLEKAFFILNEYLDSINLTKIDNKKEYDKSSFETDNKEQGLR